MMRNVLGILLAVSLLAACSSPQKNYYVLSSASAPQTTGSQEITTLIGIGPVEVAEYLNRLQIVWQSGQGELLMSGNHYWAEPLDKGVTRALALNLTAVNSSRTTVVFPWRTDNKPRYSVRVQVQAFDRIDSNARIDAVWQLVDNDAGQVIHRKRLVQTTPAGSGIASLTRAYSVLLEILAKDIEGSLTGFGV
jgi:uncharacterized lipoprotein YmbA